MKNILHIDAAFDKPELLELMIERLACRRSDNGYYNIIVNREWEAIETSCTETYVSGTVALNDDLSEPVNNPFITRFVFTCGKFINQDYKLLWSMSLN